MSEEEIVEESNERCHRKDGAIVTHSRGDAMDANARRRDG